MASDEDYMAFLDKANKDVGGGQAPAQQQSSGGKGVFKALDEGSPVPKAIKDISPRPFYESDTDEPFEPVSLKWDGEGGLPDEVEFAKLIHHWDAENADIQIMDPVGWDAQCLYTHVIDAVREASKGNDVRVYRVERDTTRVEYWVVSRFEGKIIGMKALAIES
ncbi:hypothetical protein HRG_002428 [Hirsutella rhossiliensis]|uniref:Uncharacterized protein n=1 Tax=Hirsutella rhossiliensis TaxID=111463 RepID=A0A9P8N761_9HYPO|nr:uncharacterized protein HRG_02428 [Hirsutella rhossiliensis]KAH0967019.1 hypothetical protein HRG_02428 [Hirsutella rhossiliensis]